jgi:acetyl-CoA C-acetyltransferase
MTEHSWIVAGVRTPIGAMNGAPGDTIGGSGAPILVTLLNALRRTGGQRGVASLCISDGEAVALAVKTLGS